MYIRAYQPKTQFLSPQNSDITQVEKFNLGNGFGRNSFH